MEQVYDDIPVLGVIPRLEHDSVSRKEAETFTPESVQPPQRPNVVDGRVVFKNSDK